MAKLCRQTVLHFNAIVCVDLRHVVFRPSSTSWAVQTGSDCMYSSDRPLHHGLLDGRPHVLFRHGPPHRVLSGAVFHIYSSCGPLYPMSIRDIMIARVITSPMSLSIVTHLNSTQPFPTDVSKTQMHLLQVPLCAVFRSIIAVADRAFLYISPSIPTTTRMLTSTYETSKPRVPTCIQALTLTSQKDSSLIIQSYTPSSQQGSSPRQTGEDLPLWPGTT